MKRKAFSLVELLVAMAVFGLLCLLLFSIVGRATALWRDQEKKQEGFREARAALSIFSRDLQNAIVSTNSSWFHASSNRIAFLAALPATAQAAGHDRGDICVVGYSLEWGRVNPDDPGEVPSLSLYRYVRFSDPTYATILSGSNPVESVFDGVDGSQTVRDLLARNITAMSCRVYATNESGQPVAYAASGALPDIFSLSVSAIDGKTAGRLATQQQWHETNSALIRQSEQTFSLVLRMRKP